MGQAFSKLRKVDSQILENVDLSFAQQVSSQFELWYMKVEIVKEASQLIGDRLSLSQLHSLKMDYLEHIVKSFVPLRKMSVDQQIEVLKNSCQSEVTEFNFGHQVKSRDMNLIAIGS